MKMIEPGLSPSTNAGQHDKKHSMSAQSSPGVVGRGLSLADLTSRSGSPAFSSSGSLGLFKSSLPSVPANANAHAPPPDATSSGSGSAFSPRSDLSSIRTPDGPAFHDSLLFSTLDNLNPAHSMTPKYRPSPFASAPLKSPSATSPDSLAGAMSSSRPGAGQQQQQQRPGPSRRHQPQQVRPNYGQSFSQQPPPPQQPPHYYAPSPAITTPEHGYLSREQSSGSGQGFAGNPQRPPSFMGQYTMPASSAMYGPQQYTFSQPGLQISGMPLSHSHSAPPMSFGMSMATSHSSMYTSSYAPSSSMRPGHPQHQQTQDHTPSPPSGFEGGSSQPGSGPPSSTPIAAGAVYTQSPQQPFPLYSYGHPQLTTTPQFPPYSSSPFQQQVQQRSPYPSTSYSYMTAPSPTSAEDHTSNPPPFSWWYVQSPTSGPGPSSSNTPATSGASPYGGVYYLDAYGNPTHPPIGANYSGPSSLSVNRPPMDGGGQQYDAQMQMTSAIGIGAGSAIVFPFSAGPGSTTGPGTSRPGSSIAGSASARDPPLPSPLALGDSASERAAASRVGMSDGIGGRRGPGNASVSGQRSEWVMWVGNVPSDATHDELWRFFTASPGLGAQRAGAASQHHVPVLPQQPPHLLPSGLLSPAGSSSASSAPFSTNSAGASAASGVHSIFLIARSNCAFVNYATSTHLSAAVASFNGTQLRAGDPRCPRLVCRVRGKDEDQRAGVGGQRNMGMHTRWVKQQKELERNRERQAGAGQAGEGPREGEGHTTGDSETESAAGGSRRGRKPPHSSSSGSTTSGFLQQNFPKRYFILKSLTQYDLDLSVKRGLWATQVHNETILNQAFRTSSDVYLIFGVNKSGEFFGYARMAGPIGKAEEKVSWASRSDSTHSHSPAASLSSSHANRSQISEPIPEESESPSPEHRTHAAVSLPERQERERNPARPSPSVMLFSPDHQAQSSPQPVTEREEQSLENVETAGSNVPSGEASTAPPAMGRKAAPWIHSPLVEPETAPAIMEHARKDPRSSSEPLLLKPTAATLDPRLGMHHPSIPLTLNPDAPKLAVRANQLKNEGESGRSESGSQGTGEYIDEDNIKRRDMHDSYGSGPKAATYKTEPQKEASSASQTALPPPFRSDYNDSTLQQDQADDAQWGTPFKIQWIKVGRLPFHRTRNLRNPWNHEREVKVSRDGTELEPGVGQALLDEWEKDEAAPNPIHPPQLSSPTGAGASSGEREREASLGARRGGLASVHMRRRTQPAGPTSPDRDVENPHGASAPPRSPFPQRGRGR